jgi:aspartate kinase
MEGLEVHHVTGICKVTVHSVPDRPGIAAEIFGDLGLAGVNVELVVHASTQPPSPESTGMADVSFAVSGSDLDATLNHLSQLKDRIGASNVTHRSGMALISVRSMDLAREPGAAGRIFGALSAANINLDMISTSFGAITFVVEETRSPDAVIAVETHFRDRPRP